MGIIQYELREYEKSIHYLDKAIVQYPQFSDALYYKGLCYLQTGDTVAATSIMLKAKANFEQGYTINEDDSFYERYPYQVNWHMAQGTIPGYKK